MKYSTGFIPVRQISPRVAGVLLTVLLLAIAYPPGTNAQPTSEFRWLNPKTDSTIWEQIHDAFKRELGPDASDTNTGVAFRFKFLERVGIIDHSALVIVGHQTAKVPKADDVGERFSSAFDFDLQTGAMTKIEHAERMWHWKFKKLAQLESPGASDVAFTYLTCWECEPSEVLSTFRYDPARKQWAMREWEVDRMIWWTGQNGLVVDADILEGADNTASFVCLYGVIELHGKDGNVASRCRELTEIVDGRKIVTDVTVVYSLNGELLTVSPVTKLEKVAEITAKLCEENRTNTICKLPVASTYNSPKLTMLGTFPNAPNAVRDVKCFEALHGDISMYAVAEKCGRPDGGGGTAVGFFDYRMDDGSKVSVHWTDMIHILDIVQSDKSGKTKTLFARR